RVRDRFLAELHGNPLALLELTRSLSISERAGGFVLPSALPLTVRIEDSLLQRTRRLPRETQRLLLLAAAEPIGDLALLWRAAALLGIGNHAASAAQAEGIIELGVHFRFCHPLARSAVYRAADANELTEVHEALAGATDPVEDPDRRAWHLAHAVNEPSEFVANELESSASRAKSRGGNAAAAALLKRATDLTPSPGRRASRALAAARASFEAGIPDMAHALLATAEAGPLDELQRARVRRLHAQIVFARTRGPQASTLLLEAAYQLLPLNKALARETYMEAFASALFTGRHDEGRSLRAVAEAALVTPVGPEPSRPIDLLLDGLAARFTRGNAVAVDRLRRALEAFESGATHEDDRSTRWLWLAWFVAGDLWDSRWWSLLADRATTLAREAGSLSFLPVCLEGSAAAHLHAGDFTAADALIQESDTISQATGNEPLSYCSLVLAAWRGDEAAAVTLIDSRTQAAKANGEGRVMGLAGYTTAVLYNGLARYELALEAARRGAEHDDLELTGFALAELVEAGARAGAPDVAADALERL